jgi:hypothetical protein
MPAQERIPGSSRMPQEAREAALATFARIIRERHPGVAVWALTGEGPDRTVVSSPSRKVLRPFAAPEDRDALLDRHGVGADRKLSLT